MGAEEKSPNIVMSCKTISMNIPATINWQKPILRMGAYPEGCHFLFTGEIDLQILQISIWLRRPSVTQKELVGLIHLA